VICRSCFSGVNSDILPPDMIEACRSFVQKRPEACKPAVCQDCSGLPNRPGACLLERGVNRFRFSISDLAISFCARIFLQNRTDRGRGPDYAHFESQTERQRSMPLHDMAPLDMLPTMQNSAVYVQASAPPSK
jgi:hypothetical protein